MVITTLGIVRTLFKEDIMRPLSSACFLLVAAQLTAAPVPTPQVAKPAVLKAGTETNIQWIVTRVVSRAHIAVLQDDKTKDLPIVKRHKDDLAPWLEKNFRIERPKEKNVVKVTFREGKPDEQEAIINAVVTDFLKSQVGKMRAMLEKSQEDGRRLRSDDRLRPTMTPEEIAQGEEAAKQREEQIRALPALIEKAKAR
jgi:hypothetical protein